MNLADVMDDVGAALSAIDGLRVFAYSADSVVAPAAIVGWPDPLEYDNAMARGADRQTVPLWVMVGRLDARTTRTRMAVYLDGSGPASVKAAIEAHVYTACDSVRVTTAEVDAYIVGAVEYLGAKFELDIIGKGA